MNVVLPVDKTFLLDIPEIAVAFREANVEPLCKVCSHEHANSINVDLLRGVSVFDLPKKYPGLSHMSFWRHNNRHLRPAIYNAYIRHVDVHGELDEGEIIGDLNVVRRVLKSAAIAGEDRTKSANSMNGLSRTLLQVSGALGGDGTQINLNLNTAAMSSVEPVVQKILAALSDHPDAQQAVLQALDTIDLTASEEPKPEPEPEVITPGAAALLSHYTGEKVEPTTPPKVEDAEVVEPKKIVLPDW